MKNLISKILTVLILVLFLAFFVIFGLGDFGVMFTTSYLSLMLVCLLLMLILIFIKMMLMFKKFRDVIITITYSVWIVSVITFFVTYLVRIAQGGSAFINSFMHYGIIVIAISSILSIIFILLTKDNRILTFFKEEKPSIDRL